MNETATPAKGPHRSFWLWVMCLTGVDYFSTLGYQPSIAFEATGMLAPLATVVLVALTLFGALPVYSFVADQSPHGQGSVGMLERLVSGWGGKALVLVLLGFAATDFVITKTLSAADAAEHVIANPLWPFPGASQTGTDRQRLLLTTFLLVLLGATFLRGFGEVISLAVAIVGVYLLLNLILVVAGLLYLAEHPARLSDWFARLQSGEWYLHERPLSGTSWWTIAALCLLFFPKLALGLSGFETGVAVMPLIRGKPGDDSEHPEGRIRNARKLLLTAALIMSVLLLASSLLVSTLIPPAALVEWDAAGNPIHGARPPAKDRALAYLAHGEGGEKISPICGQTFGTIYDISTVVILWFAGASAMAGLLNLVPQYLPRYGMAPEWAAAIRPLVLLFTAVNLLVTWVFNASVSAQGGAYATGVLVLISSACVATVIQRWRERAGNWATRAPWGYLLITAVFLYTTVAIVVEKPVGLKIASCFIGAVLVSSLVSRVWRVKELRFKGLRFKDAQSQFLWQSLQYAEFPVLVPHRPGPERLAEKEAIIRRDHRLTPDVPIVFIEVSLGDVSDFYHMPLLEVTQQEGRILLKVSSAASISHTLTAIALELSKVANPPEIHFGWSDETPLAASVGFLLFGEGNVPQKVRELLMKAEPNPERRPRVIVG
jgi:hypothetical protein